MQFAPFQVGNFLDAFCLGGLALHWHMVLGSALVFHALVYVSQWLSPRLFGQHYLKLAPRKRLDWDTHVVAFIFSIVISTLALKQLQDPVLKADKVWGYTRLGGDVNAISCGYFLWDIYVSSMLVKEHGYGMLVHAFASFAVFIFGLGPFTFYYGAVFILFELSTPFLNVNWFLDKCGLTGTWLQLVNGILFILTFFCARILWGFYMSFQYFSDLWAQRHIVPVFHLALYGVSNSILMTLNVFWFFKIIAALRRRFDPKAASPQKKKK